MRKTPPLVVLVLGGAAAPWGTPAAESPLALAPTPNLDRLARAGRVIGVRLIEEQRHVATAAPLLSLLGFDPAESEISPASYLGAAAGHTLDNAECYACADFVSLFRHTVADIEPGPLRPAETEALFEVASVAIQRAGFRLIRLGASHHLAIAPRASVDPDVPPTFCMAGAVYEQFQPQVEQHAFAHRLARAALDGHEVNEVRRDLGGNGWDALWLWGPGGAPNLQPAEGSFSAHGSHPLWRGVAQAAGLRLGTKSGSAIALVRDVARAMKKDDVVWIYLRRGVRDALLRELRLRAHGLADLDNQVIGPLAEVVRKAGGRMIVTPDAAWDTASGRPTADPVPALLWGEGVQGLRELPFTEEGAAGGGEPIAPGYGLVEYVRSL